jgi:histidine triad (HIT) family protein
MVEHSDQSCVFCGIVAGVLPSRKVHEDERVLAFMDINPISDGHLLVIPKAHARDLHDVPADDLAACAVVAQQLAGLVVERLGADGVNLLNCTGEAAFQSVFHVHLHVIPRYADDAERDRLGQQWVPQVVPGDPDRIAEIAALLGGAG